MRTYSQGMRRRLGLAAALLRDPVVLLLDEPTNGMDPAGIRELRSLLRSLADEGATVLLSSHLLAEIEQLCDRVAVLRDGRLVAQGPVGELLHRGSRIRVVVDPGERGAAARLLRRWRCRTGEPGELLVEDVAGREANRVLAEGGVWAHQITEEPVRLEEAYVRLMGEQAAAPAEVPFGAAAEKEEGHAADPR